MLVLSECLVVVDNLFNGSARVERRTRKLLLSRFSPREK
jgi:hypothetical protein